MRQGLEELELENFSSTNAVNPWDVTFPGSTVFGKNGNAKGNPDKANRSLMPFTNPLINSVRHF